MIDLYNGDCLEIMKQIPDKSVDMILCDLPYGSTACPWDIIIPFDSLWEQYNRICKGVICLFSAGLFTIDLINSNRKNFKYKMIWKKNTPTGMCSAKYRPMKYYEEICVFNEGIFNPQPKARTQIRKRSYNYMHTYCSSNHIKLNKLPKKYDPDWVNPSDILEFNTVPNRKGKLHPTQKPVDLLEWLIKTYSNEGDIILDNCMGVGSTGVACNHLSRNFIGIELNPNYFEIAKNRIESELL